MATPFGPFRVRSLTAGRFAIDGGVAFGVVPRALWARQIEPDDQGRVAMVSRILVVDRGDRRLLLDAGPGQAWSEKPRSLYRIEEGPDLPTLLQEAGIDPASITDVVLSHLHWDHASGVVRFDEAGELTLALPQAVHHVQRRNWRWASAPSEYDRRAYRLQDLRCLERSGRLHFVEGETELFEGVHLITCEGHTVGQQVVRIGGGERTLLYCADIIPTAAHLSAAWGLAYDLYPLTLIEEKKQLLAEALVEGWVLAFPHDPRLAACTLREVDGRVTIADEVEL
jgi:glyoxylase-like metal-dependent hydrolase (beta-lactamase superfamily II)